MGPRGVHKRANEAERRFNIQIVSKTEMARVLRGAMGPSVRVRAERRNMCTELVVDAEQFRAQLQQAIPEIRARTFECPNDAALRMTAQEFDEHFRACDACAAGVLQEIGGGQPRV